jgi:hypothetical protein
MPGWGQAGGTWTALDKLDEEAEAAAAAASGTGGGAEQQTMDADDRQAMAGADGQHHAVQLGPGLEPARVS